MHISSIHVYPIKSCAGISLSTATLDARGIEHDRQWMVVSERKGFMTQRQIPKMATVTTQLTDSQLIMRAPTMPEIQIPIAGDAQARREPTVVWNETLESTDQGDEIAAWLCTYLERDDLRLMRLCDDSKRSFVDSRPLLIISKNSLNDLNSRLPVHEPMDRFRPNIVIDGVPPYAEDELDEIQLGSVKLMRSKKCSRCVIIGKAALKALATYRRVDSPVFFGSYFIPDGMGSLSVGDVE